MQRGHSLIRPAQRHIRSCVMAKRLASTFFLLALVVGLPTMTTGGSSFDYGDALDQSLLFFEAQRSGKLPGDQRVKWRADSGLRDGFLQGVDLVGGYYDAGDHVKFGLPMAFSVTILSWAAVDFSEEIISANQMANTLWAIRWGTDYFLKAHTQPNLLWAQVGDGASDHYCWERAEDMTTPRTAYKLDSNNPGSDLAGETAASLAAASLAFKPYNSSYSHRLLAHAEQLFTFADTFRGLYDDSIPGSSQFYASSGFEDELLWAAAWLYRATQKDYYLQYVVKNAASMGGTGWAVREFSWDNKYAGVQILLSKVLLEGRDAVYASTLKQYQAKADFFACSCLQKNDGYNVALTRGGLVYVREWNNMQYASSAAFLLAIYSEYLSSAKAVLNCPDGLMKPQDLLNFAKSQADYILGKNPKSMSYLVGYGANYPTHVHHRGASIPPISILHNVVGCVEGFDAWYNRPQANPNVINGALVGGPNSQDDFTDDRSNYEQTEPTLSGTAPVIGLFAKLSSSNTISGLYQQQDALPLKTSAVPVEFLHSITSTWSSEGVTYYRHRVLVKNTSEMPIADLKLKIENLTGLLYGLNPTREKGIYETPQWLRVLKPGSEFPVIYIQGGPQAKISVASYN
ncbi:hypothetical protein Nepgr_013763 [Nepenthes gracilis]|uniref:Endoglucanase n=1 Tax=Nepenthes gracilis TaxID=150966 RepID=A0AAD3XNY2_NEPGR|nr:hypothetical protein Nepgr_013763 [Nepenthes gracilis]